MTYTNCGNWTGEECCWLDGSCLYLFREDAEKCDGYLGEILQEDNMIIIEVIKGCEGCNLQINNIRVDGPKAWGGGKIIHSFLVSEEDLKSAIKTARSEGG